MSNGLARRALTYQTDTLLLLLLGTSIAKGSRQPFVMETVKDDDAAKLGLISGKHLLFDTSVIVSRKEQVLIFYMCNVAFMLHERGEC